MTTQRKKLDGVSVAPWSVSYIQEHGSGCIYDRELRGVVGDLAPKIKPVSLTDLEFIVYARNQWPAICDLIDALGKYRESSAALEEHNCGAVWCPGNDYCDVAYKIFQEKTEDFHRLMTALDKLNGQEEK